MTRILWWVCLLLAPAVLIGLELFHSANFTAHPSMYQYLSQAEPNLAAHHHALDYFGPRWWLVLHMIQTPMVGLVAVGLLLMVDGLDDEDGAAAVALGWLARAAIFVMVIYFTVLDAIGGVGSFVSETASWAALAASLFIAAALLLSRRAGWANMAVLVAFGWELQTDHAAPRGPIAFALLIVAAGWLWFSRTRRVAAL